MTRILLCFLLLVSSSTHAQRRETGHRELILRPKRDGFFGHLERLRPLTTIHRNFKGLTNNMGKSVKTLMTALSSGMKRIHEQAGRYTLRPALINIGTSAGSQGPIQAPKAPTVGLGSTPHAAVGNSGGGNPAHDVDPELVGENQHHHHYPQQAEQQQQQQPSVDDQYNYDSVDQQQGDYQYGGPGAQYQDTHYQGDDDTDYPPVPSTKPTPTSPVSLHHLTPQEICDHLKSLKEDIHSAPVNHPGEGGHGLDVHKFEKIGVHSSVQKSSAQVPDQIHPEKYTSVDCSNIRKVVNTPLYYKDTKQLLQNIKGKNVVRGRRVDTKQ